MYSRCGKLRGAGSSRRRRRTFIDISEQKTSRKTGCMRGLIQRIESWRGVLAEHSEIVQAAEWAETVERFEYFPRSILAFLWLSLGMVDTDDRDAFMRELTVGPR